MAQFKNLVFLSHPMNPTKAIMAKYRFDNGKEISVVAGEGLYSSGKSGVRTGVSSPEEVTQFEVMFEGEVTGWVSRDDIDKIMLKNS